MMISTSQVPGLPAMIKQKNLPEVFTLIENDYFVHEDEVTVRFIH